MMPQKYISDNAWNTWIETAVIIPLKSRTISAFGPNIPRCHTFILYCTSTLYTVVVSTFKVSRAFRVPVAVTFSDATATKDTATGIASSALWVCFSRNGQNQQQRQKVRKEGHAWDNWWMWMWSGIKTNFCLMLEQRGPRCDKISYCNLYKFAN